MSDDPLVQVWQDTARPLNWRPWCSLSDAEQARMRFLLMDELQIIAADVVRRSSFHWRHTHRELLELKAACGHA